MADPPPLTGDPRKKLSSQRLHIDTSISPAQHSPTLSSNTPRPPLHPSRTHSASDAPAESTRQYGGGESQDAASAEANDFTKVFSQLTEAQFQIQSLKTEQRRLEELGARHKSDLERAKRMKSYPATISMLQEMKDKSDSEIRRVNSSQAELQEVCRKLSAQLFTKGNFQSASSSSNTPVNRSEPSSALLRDQKRIDSLEKELEDLKVAMRNSQKPVTPVAPVQWPAAEFGELQKSVQSHTSQLACLKAWKDLFDRKKLKLPLELMPEVLLNLPQDLKDVQSKAEQATTKADRAEATTSKISQEITSLKASTPRSRSPDLENLNQVVDVHLSRRMPSFAEQVKQSVSSQIAEARTDDPIYNGIYDRLHKLETARQGLETEMDARLQRIATERTNSPHQDPHQNPSIIQFREKAQEIERAYSQINGTVLQLKAQEDRWNKSADDLEKSMEQLRVCRTGLHSLEKRYTNINTQDMVKQIAHGIMQTYSSVPKLTEDLQAIKNQVNADLRFLNNRIDTLPAPPVIDADQVNADLQTLKERIDKLPAQPAIDVHRVNTDLQSLKEKIDKLPAQPSIDVHRVHADLHTLKERIDKLPAQPTIDVPQVNADLQSLKREMDKLCAIKVHRVPYDLRILKERVDKLPAQPTIDVDKVNADIQSLRDRIQALPAPPDMGPITTGLQTLNNRIDTLPPPPPAADVDMDKVNEAIELRLAPLEQSRQSDSESLSRQLKDLHELQELFHGHSTSFGAFSDDTSGDLQQLKDVHDELKDELKALAQNWQEKLEGRTSQYDSLKSSFEELQKLADRLKVLEPFDRIPQVLDSLGSTEELSQLHEALKNRENTVRQVDELNQLLGQLNGDMSAISEDQMNTMRSQLSSELAEKMNEMFSRERKSTAKNVPDLSNGHSHQAAPIPTPEVPAEASTTEQPEGEVSESDQLGVAISSMFQEEPAAASGQDTVMSPSDQLSQSLMATSGNIPSIDRTTLKERASAVKSSNSSSRRSSPSIKSSKLVSSLKRVHRESSPSGLHIRGLSNTLQPQAQPKTKKRTRFADSSGDEKSSQVNAPTDDSSSSRASKKLKKQLRKERRREARNSLT